MLSECLLKAVRQVWMVRYALKELYVYKKVKSQIKWLYNDYAKLAVVERLGQSNNMIKVGRSR